MILARFPRTSALLALGCFLAGPARADVTVNFSTSDAGVKKAIPDWGLDTNWASLNNMRRGLFFMGVENVSVVRLPGMVDKAMEAGLTSEQKSHMQECLDIAALAMAVTKWDLCAPGSDTVHAWFQTGAGTVSVDRWAQALKANQEFYNRTMWMVEPFNEPDYATWGEGTKQNLADIMDALKKMPAFADSLMAGGSTMSADQAAPWYDALGGRAKIGTTHGLYGTVDSYVSFIQHVVATGGVPIHPEGHNVVEAIIGAEYGLAGLIWWGTAEKARGDFLRASLGMRLGYAEDRANWTAAAVYRAPSGAVQAFLGSSERVGGTTTYTFHSTDRDVYYDGHGPQRDYSVTIRANQERVVNITWGADVESAIGGRYAIVNAGTGLCLEVGGASTASAAALQQNAYTGASHQLWDVTPLAESNIGDLSYFNFANVNSQLYADLADWAYADEAPVKQYNYPANEVERWYLDYAGNGRYRIRSRWSGKCVSVSRGGGLHAAVVQRAEDGGADQLWSFQPPASTPVAGPLQIATPPQSLTAMAGQTLRLSVGATGTGRLAYQWARDGVAIPGATGAQLVLTDVQATAAGRYTVTVTDLNGSVTSPAATVALSAVPAPTGPYANLVNIAARAYCGTSDRVTIGGFVVAGSVAKTVLVRAVGPSLASWGVAAADVLLDPAIEVHDALHDNAIIATNDNWRDAADPAAIASTAATIGAIALAGNDGRSAALLLTLNPGVYSFVVNGQGATSGVVLLEVYDADAARTGSTFMDIAARAYATKGSGVTIGGFVVGGSQSKQVLMRAVGPTLGSLGVNPADVLADPTIELHDALRDNAVVEVNDNWGDNANAAAIRTTAARLGATALAANDTKSAALLLSLNPGVYSFIARGQNDTSGVVLVEVYDAD